MTKQSKAMQFQDILYKLRRQYPIWPSTFGLCMNESCNSGMLARGSGPCITCIEKELVELVGEDLAIGLSESISEQARIIHTIMEELDED